jgi:hypothetical protein
VTFLSLLSLGTAAAATGNPPVVTHAFAIEKGQYGTIWKIYLEAEDPDGDMLKIASVVNQTGYGHYPTDFVFIKQPNQKKFRGYLQWNTFSSRTSFLRERTNITLTVSVLDKAGNESNEVVFPFSFETGARSNAEPSPAFSGEVQRLGYIQIDLFEPTLMGNGDTRTD